MLVKNTGGTELWRAEQELTPRRGDSQEEIKSADVLREIWPRNCERNNRMFVMQLEK
jgi:hypothetical protein